MRLKTLTVKDLHVLAEMPAAPTFVSSVEASAGISWESWLEAKALALLRMLWMYSSSVVSLFGLDNRWGVGRAVGFLTFCFYTRREILAKWVATTQQMREAIAEVKAWVHNWLADKINPWILVQCGVQPTVE